MLLRCLIVDDNALFREEARGLLEEQGIDVVGAAESGAQALRQVARLTPDVALVDIDLGEESGLDLAHPLRAVAGSALRIILISTHAVDWRPRGARRRRRRPGTRHRGAERAAWNTAALVPESTS
jgi:DNA-binding NarL/FixJ family response regulator